MKNFTLKIKLGNEAMQDELDVIEALTAVIHKLGGGLPGGFILDVNGNTVGEWKLS